jgi:hypothetical protein
MAHISEAAPLQISRFYTGLYTFRNPLIVPIKQMGRRIIELYDALSDGLNMECTNRLTLARRPGYTAVNNTPINGQPLWFYTFKPSDFPGQIYNVVDSTADIEYLQVGVIPPQQLVLKQTPPLTNFATVGAYLYIAQELLSLKWDAPGGVQGITKWGIDISPGTPAIGGGPHPPGSGTNLPSNQIPAPPPWVNPGAVTGTAGFATVDLSRSSSITTQGPNSSTSWAGMWTNNQNVAVLDGNFATVNIQPLNASPVFVAQGFNFALPANAVVTGIQAHVSAQMTFATGGSQPICQMVNVQLRKAGAAVGDNLGSSLEYIGPINDDFGSQSTTWGTTWTAADVNHPQFGLQLHFVNATPDPSTVISMGIDHVSLTVSFAIPASQATLTSQWLAAENFGFAIPFPPPTTSLTLVITGIEVTLSGLETQGVGIGLKVRLIRNGALFGDFRKVTLPANDTTVTIGSPGDLWDGNWQLSDVNSPTFGVGIQAVNSSSMDAMFSVDNVSVTIFTAAAPVASLGPADPNYGPLVAQNGFRYVYCYGNSHSGGISSPTPPSNLVLPTAGVSLNIIASTDTQVTDIHVYRSTDGGGSPFFELPTSPYPNVTKVINDSAPDSALQIANEAPDPHQNDAPPGGAIDPVWFAGRLWMHRGNKLFFATGPDVKVGNGEQAWYPVYVFALPGGEIIRKFPLPNGMLVVTADEIFIVRGLSTASFTVNEFMRDTGIRTWTAGDSDGSNIYLYTSDRQLLLINANGLQTVSEVIADKIQVVDPTLAYVAQFRYTALENLLFLGDGSTFLYPLNVELQAWATPQAPVNGVGAIGTVETTPGVFQFWRGRPVVGSTITFRDVTTFADEGTPYPCHSIFGPIPVADFLTLAQLRDIALANAATSSQVTVSVLANEIFPLAASQYQILAISSSEPPELSATPSISFGANRYTWKSAPLPELVNFCFLRIDFSADPNPDELFVWCIGGTQTTGGSSLGAPGQLPPIQGR